MDSKPSSPRKTLPCPRCGNRLRILADQVGTQVKCPKCEAVFTVGRPGVQRPAPAASDADDAYEPEIPLRRSTIVEDEDFITPATSAERIPIKVFDPAPIYTPDERTAAPADSSAELAHPETEYEVDWSSVNEVQPDRRPEPPPDIFHEHLASARAKGLLREDLADPPPRWTFFSGVLDFPWRKANLGRWAIMGCGLSLSGTLLAYALRMTGQGGLGPMLVPVLTIFSVVFTLPSCGFAAAAFLAAVEDTAEGHRDVQDSTIPDWDQWIFSFLGVLNVWLISGAFGYPLTLFESIGPVAIPLVAVVMFPILLLSALEGESFLIPYSLAIWGTLARKWWVWALFYLLAIPLLLGTFAGLDFLFVEAPDLAPFAIGPVLATAILIYARLLGRLGWRISGSALRTRGSTGQSVPPPARKRRRRAKLRVRPPADFDRAAEMVADDRPPDVSSRRRG